MQGIKTVHMDTFQAIRFQTQIPFFGKIGLSDIIKYKFSNHLFIVGL